MAYMEKNVIQHDDMPQNYLLWYVPRRHCDPSGVPCFWTNKIDGVSEMVG